MNNRSDLAQRWILMLRRKPIIAVIVVISTIAAGAAAFLHDLESFSDWATGWTRKPKIVAFTLSRHSQSYEEKVLPLLRSRSQTFRTFQPQVPVASESDPVFLVTISNPTKHDVIFTRVLFEIQSVGNVEIPTPVDPLPPAAMYSYKILHAPGSKPDQLVPPFRVKSESADSFDLQIASASKGDGLAWLMRIGFVTTEGQKVYTEPFQLVLLGAGEETTD